MAYFVSDSTEIQIRENNNKFLGSLTWHTTATGDMIVNSVFVAEHARRQGVATTLWNKAREMHPTLKHSPHQSDAGQAWSASLNS